MDNKNEIKVYTTSNGAELNISAPSTKQVISATNNRAQYFAEQAKKYRDEAKLHRDNAKYYAEQNSDVTFEYIDSVRATLEDKIATKQDNGNYALKEELPVNVSELENDAQYVVKSEFDSVTQALELPSQEGCAGKFLMSDGENESWVGINTFQLFDTKLSDKVLTYEESKGWALQGTYVYKTAVVGERYGYPDFYNKCLEEYNGATQTETVNGVSVKIYRNRHKFYDIADKTAIDEYCNTVGSAWFYGVDIENERIFLPRNNWFDQATGDTSQVGKSIEAGLPDHAHSLQINVDTGSGGSGGELPLKQDGAANKTNTYTTELASLNNAVYGNSDTVQPPAVKKLLYICVGNTMQDTSWVDVVTQVEGGVKDLEDKTNEGLEALANASNALRQTQITNCLLEVPQNIKLELTDGVLTLKSGSKVIVPYGVEDLTAQYPVGSTFLNNNFKVVDTQYSGNKFFVWVEVQNDITRDYSTATWSGLVYININGNGFTGGTTSYSGATYPTTGSGFFYDTSKNIVTFYNQGVEQDYIDSLPICVATMPNSINQIFNGVGYIGSTVFCDKGVKGLVPNGRNEDGTLNNIEFTTQKVLTANINSAVNINNGAGRVLINSTGTGFIIRIGSYDPVNNYVLGGNGVDKIMGCVVLDNGYVTNGHIDSFDFKLPFHAVDYNDALLKSDKSEITGWFAPSNKQISFTVGETGSTITAPANGYVALMGNTSATSNAFVYLISNGVDNQGNGDGATGKNIHCSIPVAKGATVLYTYYNVKDMTLRFIYAQGDQG